METRAKSSIYLIKNDAMQIVGCKLPSNGQVLRVLFFNMRKVNLNLRDSANLVAKEIEIHWNKARIPTRRIDRTVLKIEILYQEWKSLQKTCNRRSALQVEREEHFLEKLEDLFDIAHADAMNVICPEDKVFLENQRKKGRLGSMLGCDQALAQKEKRKKTLMESEDMRRKKQLDLCAKNVELVWSSEDDEELMEADEVENINYVDVDVDVDEPMRDEADSNQETSFKPQNFISPKLVATLDRCKVSDRDSVRILIATAQALGHDVRNLTISKSTIRRCRKNFRIENAKQVRKTFDEKQIGALTLHWDGKILQSLTGKDKVERVPVVITSSQTEQLLGVPKLGTGTGKEQATAILDLLENWEITDKVQALCCDTTATNMGRLKGASVLLEQEMGRDLLYLPCRHHIYEIILRTCFDKSGLESFGPTLSIFNRFQGAWSTINKSNYCSGLQDKAVKTSIKNTVDILEFSEKYVQMKQPRADYKELIELTMIFLGTTPLNYTFRSPGAFHHARWMAKAIYALKIFLFRKEFTMSETENYSIREACVFIIQIYVKPWIQATDAAKAPNQDLNFLKNLFQYRTTNEKISHEALRKFSNHLWYLSPEATALSFFDTDLTHEEKREMVKSLKNESNECKKISVKDINDYNDKKIEYFVCKGTLKFFERFSIPTEFLQIDPLEWESDIGYQYGLNIVNSLHVVNDTAERAVKLIEEYNKVLSTDEEEKQYILQIVSDHRKQYPDTNKATLCG